MYLRGDRVRERRKWVRELSISDLLALEIAYCLRCLVGADYFFLSMA